MDLKLQAPMFCQFSIDSAPLVFSFHLSGCGQAHIRHSRVSRKTVYGRPNEVVVSFSPNSSCKTELMPDQHYRVFNIYAHPQGLLDRLEGMLDQIPRDILGILSGEVVQSYISTRCLTPETRLVLEQINACPYTGGMQRLFLEQKALELVFHQLHDAENSRAITGFVPLHAGDVDRLHEARSILLQDIADPPSLPSLACRVGVNTSKLKAGFKQVFGATVFGVLRQERLVRARRLLLEGRLNITEISQHLGFSDASHFIREFSKHYGVTPGRFVKDTQ